MFVKKEKKKKKKKKKALYGSGPVRNGPALGCLLFWKPSRIRTINRTRLTGRIVVG